MKPKLMLLAIALVLVSSSAFASISLIPSTEQASLSRNDSIGIQFRLRNNGFERTCIELETEQNDSYIDTSLGDDFVCLNQGETTYVTVVVRTHNAPTGLQLVTLNAYSNQGDDYSQISVFVGGEPEIELVAYPADICMGKQEYINVLVRNNSDEYKQVKLQAENEMLLPYFERQDISLMPYQEKYVELRLHASPYSSEGRHYISIYAITSHETVKERLSVDIVECGEPQTEEFSVKMPTGCLTVQKGREERIYFTVENRLYREQKVYFSVGGNLDAKLNTYSAWLEGKQRKEFYFEVLAEEQSRVQDYEIALHVWNQDHSVEKSVCVRPERIHLIGAEVIKNDLVIDSLRSAVFTILVKNKGDYTEDFSLSLDNGHSQIEALLSQTRFTLGKGESKEIYVSVSALDRASPGNYSIWLEARANGEDIRKQLFFRVLEEPIGAESSLPLEIVSYASSLRMQENSTKTLSVTVRNNSAEPIEAASIELYGLPENTTATAERNISLQPGQEKEFGLEISAGDGTSGEYSLVIQAHSPEFSDARPAKLSIEEREAVQQQELLAALFSAGGSALLGLAILVIAIIALVLIARASKPKKEENWIRG